MDVAVEFVVDVIVTDVFEGLPTGGAFEAVDVEGALVADTAEDAAKNN